MLDNKLIIVTHEDNQAVHLVLLDHDRDISVFNLDNGQKKASAFLGIAALLDIDTIGEVATNRTFFMTGYSSDVEHEGFKEIAEAYRNAVLQDNRATEVVTEVRQQPNLNIVGCAREWSFLALSTDLCFLQMPDFDGTFKPGQKSMSLGKVLDGKTVKRPSASGSIQQVQALFHQWVV